MTVIILLFQILTKCLSLVLQSCIGDFLVYIQNYLKARPAVDLLWQYMAVAIADF